MNDDENINNKCAVCQKLATQKCAGCHRVYYCSKEHQKSGWKAHKKVCKPYKISTSDLVGRHLIATRKIKPGELILEEAPLIWGPAQSTIPVCVGCCKEIDQTSRPCSKCGWPVCSALCEKAPAHLPECTFTSSRNKNVSVSNFGIVHPIYQCVTVLRCLYQKKFLPEVWKKLEELQSHCAERRNTAKYESERVTIAQFALRFFGLEQDFTEEEIMRVCGIVMVNAHEVPLSEPAHVAIYGSTSMFEHSCSPNCNKSFTNSGGVLVSSGTAIEKGESLTICYTDPLWGTANRRHHLYETKFFWCTCKRCSSVDEFGTNFSAIRCQKSACAGIMLPVSFTTAKENAEWSCNVCKMVLSADGVQDTLERIGKDLAELPKGSSKECKDFIRTYEELLHPNHFYLTDVKYALSQILGQEFEGGLPNVDVDDLHLKIKLCKGLNNLFTKLIPAEKRLRGLVLFELHASITELGRRNGDPGQLHAALIESKELLQEAAELLKFEPSELPEGKIFEQAKRNLVDIDVVLRTVHHALGDSPA